MPVSGGAVLSIGGFLDGAIACLDRGRRMGMGQARKIFPQLFHLLSFIHNIPGWRTAIRIGRCGFGQSIYDCVELLYFASVAFWMLDVPLFLKTKHRVGNPLALALTGWLVLLPTGLALYQLRAIEPFLLLGFMCAIWISDTAAYFSGRAWGRSKLAPSISPGKTWEGVAGAFAAVLVYALIWSNSSSSEARPSLLVPLLLLLAAMGIVGDLFESLMKRQAGIKDSGNILPGHGGILDRIDALTSTLPLAILSLLISQSEL